MALGFFEECPYDFSPKPVIDGPPTEMYDVRYFVDFAQVEQDELPRLFTRAVINQAMVTEETLATLQQNPLNECVRCPSDLVQIFDFQEEGDNSWLIETRCPECELHICRVVGDEKADDFDMQWADGAQQLENVADDLSESDKPLYISDLKAPLSKIISVDV